MHLFPAHALLCAAAAARAVLVSVGPNDQRIAYVGDWAPGAFAIRLGVDPPGSGPNSSVCALNAPEMLTTTPGQSLTFSFTGARGYRATMGCD